MAQAQQAVVKQLTLAGDLEGALDLIRDVPDFPQPGVLFRDLTPMLADPKALGALVYGLAAACPQAEVVAGIEARGFLLAAPVAYGCGVGVVPVRKAGKLPSVAAKVSYQLEYGTAELELAEGAIRPGQRVAVIDDVLATGGTAAATCQLVEQAGGVVAGVVVVLEIAALNGRAALEGYQVTALRTV
ncbi:adenine phosphoribosyltransferase [Crossiella sp. CA-258035]|uniref:adenine phosphoribosyltransferase n=1 Tax=Crossiella sp. CA-258035 TaxID=2981138 RepID=UPI0024BD20B0|nr:adenine phosphoribosyltransferase [Crossiella sp. CA-258035]WHT23658.1 adenine phosphoribosyltransferase [Crossiella sp. CA-258035]